MIVTSALKHRSPTAVCWQPLPPLLSTLVCRLILAACLLIPALVSSPAIAYTTATGFSENSAPPPQPVDSGWAYHWGDLDYTDNWQFGSAAWTALETIDEIPGRTSEQILWIRLELPRSPWRDAHLLVNSIDLTAQVFENGQLSYQYGEIDSDGNSRFAGWPWHLVPVHTIDKPTTLYFRIYSDYPFIGLVGEILIGNRGDLLDRVYGRGIAGIVFILIVFIVGILCTCLALIKKDRRVALSAGLLSFDLVLMMFAENELSQVAYYDPLMWRYLAAFSYFLIPAFLALVIREWFQRRVPPVINGVFWVATAFTAGVALLSAFTSFSFVNAYPSFDALFIALVLALLIGCACKFRTLGRQDALVIFGVLALFISLVLDMLSAHALIDWIGRMGQWGLISFTLAMLAVYLDKDVKQQAALRTLTTTLEAQVAERTHELTESQAQLQQLAREDFLTGLLNRRAFMAQANVAVANTIRYQHPLSLMLFDIDFFKQVNDTYGHAAGDRVLQVIAEITRKECREGDLICRYGGEEFVVLLHETPRADALKLVSRLQKVIQGCVIGTADDKKVRVTASFGLISYNSHQSGGGKDQLSDPSRLLELLLNQADRAMYDVKDSGRNGIKEYDLEPTRTVIRP